MVKPDMTTEATVTSKHATMRFARMAAAIAEGRTGATRTRAVAFFEGNKSTFE